MTAEEILKKIANEASYIDWGEFMYDSHPHTQVEYAIKAMTEFAIEQMENIVDAEYKEGDTWESRIIEKIESLKSSITKEKEQ